VRQTGREDRCGSPQATAATCSPQRQIPPLGSTASLSPPPVLLALVRLVVPPVHRWRAASHDFSSAYPRELVQRARKSIGMAQQGVRIPAARISPSLDSGKGHESAGKGDSLNIKEIERLPSQPLIS